MNQLDANLVISEQTQVDFLILGDFAQVMGGKLNLMGGGWTRFSPPQYPATIQVGIAAGVRVPYSEAEDKHHIELRMEDADGAELWKVEADLETGRPAGTKGESQLGIIALNGSARLEGPGEFVVRASVDGREGRRISFKAVSAPAR